MHNELFGEAIFRAGRGFLFWYCGKFARATPSRNFYKILIPRKIFVTAATSSRSPKTKEVCDVRAHHSNCSALSGGWRSYAGWRHLSGVRKIQKSRSVHHGCGSAGHWWGHLRSKSFKGGLLILRIHGREVIWLNLTAQVGGKDVCF